MDGEVSYPDNKDREVDRKNPEHENEYGVGVVVEVVICIRSSFSCNS